MEWIKSARMLFLKAVQMYLKYPSLYLLNKEVWIHFTLLVWRCVYIRRAFKQEWI